MAPQQRYRGIFNVLFYTFNAELAGRLAACNLASIPHSETRSMIEAGTPYPALGGSDLRGLGKKDAWLAGGIQAPLAGVAGPHGDALETFGVTLVVPLNVYAMSTRAVKYGALFVGLVLMAGFMFELFRKLRLYPVQYGLVGLSTALFFLLLLALSEKLLFWQAYAAAATASVSLLAIYFNSVLGGWRRGASFAAFVALLYGPLYGLLASESNALLLGTILVFGMLAVLMLATPKVDWYALSNQSP